MFCPNCKTEYRPGFTKCSDCGAALIPKLESKPDPADQDLALAWRGSDPSGFSAAAAALEGAGIRSFPINDHDQLAWGLAIARPRYGLLVRRSDLETALEVVATIQERSPLANAKDIWKSQPLNVETETETDSSADISGSSEGESDAPDDIVEEFDPKKATLEVWSGEAATAENLRLCLRENGIGCTITEGGAGRRLSVLPSEEKRAREIVREVVDGVPPE